MADSVKKVLFVNSEIFPYVPETEISKIGRYLPQGIQERKKEIRAFMPRYGSINDRKNQLHEVIRLSGMNIIVGEVDRPLVIKVASISSARLQVYFIDNEDYFRRKQIKCDDRGKAFPDNGERALFFARGVLEAVKKQRWAPDIIHCHGWITHAIPLYLKKIYKDDPIFAGSRLVMSFYGDTPKEKLQKDFVKLALVGGLKEEDLGFGDKPDGMELARNAARYSDGVILGSGDVDPSLAAYCGTLGTKVLPYDEASFADGTYVDAYNAFYDSL